MITLADIQRSRSGAKPTRTRTGRTGGKKNVVTPMDVLLSENRALIWNGWHRLIIPLPVSVNAMYRPVGRARHVLSKEGRQFKANVEWLALKLPWCPLLSGDVEVFIVVYRPRKAGDVDNYIKGTLDAMKKFAFGDDAQVKKLTIEIEEDPAMPRAAFAVRKMIR